jgi:arylsulfatase A-like enzyme
VPFAAPLKKVLLIIVDDMGVDATRGFSSSDSGLAKIPAIENLCQRGVKFTQAWSAPTCSPTRSSIFTGRYGFRTGVVRPADATVYLKPAEVTLPQVLQAARPDIAMANIGKWHLGTVEAQGGLSAPKTFGWPLYSGLMDGQLQDYFQYTKVVNGAPQLVNVYATTETANDAIAFLNARKSDESWFLWLAFNAPHAPFHAPPKELHSVELPADVRPNAQPFFDAAIEALDREIGRVLAAAGADVDVIFVGDNGSPRRVSRIVEPQGRSKGSVFQGGVHVPLCVSGPSVQRGDRLVETPVHVVDLFSTITDAFEVPRAATGQDSVSLRPLLLGDSSAPSRAVVYTESGGGVDPADGNRLAPAWAIRDQRFKVIGENGGADKVFDLTSDPSEMKDIADSVNSTPELKSAYDALKRELKILRPEL